MHTVDEFIRSEIEDKILKLVKEIEEIHQEIVEEWSSKLGLSKPRVVVTLQEVNECARDGAICESDDLCKIITGEYYPDTMTILLNYRATLDTLLHLYVHYIQSLQIGVDRFRQIREAERLRLPWSLRPTEIRAIALAKKLQDTLCTQRIVKLWSEYVKVRIRKIDEEIQRIRSCVKAALTQTMPYVHVRDIARRMLTSYDGSWTREDKDRL